MNHYSAVTRRENVRLYMLTGIIFLIGFIYDYYRPQFECVAIGSVTTITMSGCYKLTSDIDVTQKSGVGLWVSAEDVDIDLNGKKIYATQESNLATGIYIAAGQWTKIHDGHIDGLLFGIRAEADPGEKVGNVELNHVEVSNGTARGVQIRAASAHISQSIFRDLSGYPDWPGTPTIAVELEVESCRFENNEIHNIRSETGGAAIAISFLGGRKKCSLERNKVTDMMSEPQT